METTAPTARARRAAWMIGVAALAGACGRHRRDIRARARLRQCRKRRLPRRGRDGRGDRAARQGRDGGAQRRPGALAASAARLRAARRQPGRRRPISEGGPTLLNLWATWCVPCRTEMPALDRLQASARRPGLRGRRRQHRPAQSRPRQGLPRRDRRVKALDALCRSLGQASSRISRARPRLRHADDDPRRQAGLRAGLARRPGRLGERGCDGTSAQGDRAVIHGRRRPSTPDDRGAPRRSSRRGRAAPPASPGRADAARSSGRRTSEVGARPGRRAVAVGAADEEGDGRGAARRARRRAWPAKVSLGRPAPVSSSATTRERPAGWPREKAQRLVGAPLLGPARAALVDLDDLRRARAPRRVRRRRAGPDSGRRARARRRPSSGRRRTAISRMRRAEPVRPAGSRSDASPTTSSRDCRRRGPRAGTRGRSRRPYRGAPSPRPEGPRRGHCSRPASFRSFISRSAIAATWRATRPVATIIVSAMGLLPRRSISTISSAFMSSRLSRRRRTVSSPSGRIVRVTG